MKLIKLNKYSAAAFLFMAAAAVLIAIALFTSLSEFITAAFVISGMICAMTGIFVLTFSAGEPVDPKIVGLLPVQGCLNLCRLASDLGITGNAHFLPPRLTGKELVMQYNASEPYKNSNVSVNESFPENRPKWHLTFPSCYPLIKTLIQKNSMVIPGREEDLSALISEALGEILEFAPRVSVSWHDSTVTITLRGFRFISGCQYIAKESPDCCTRSPCPACSLCGALIAQGTNKVTALDRCHVSPSHQDLIIVFSLLSPPLPFLIGNP
jgi:hypothetical protein